MFRVCVILLGVLVMAQLAFAQTTDSENLQAQTTISNSDQQSVDDPADDTGIIKNKPGPIVQREEKQQDRIDQGIQSGQLSAEEAARLERGEHKIESDREKAWSDGSLSHQEKAQLNREQNRQSAKIYNAKHNDVRSSGNFHVRASGIAQGRPHNTPVGHRR